jgi:hypothetical protein
VVVEVVGSWHQEIERGRVYSSAKLKIECRALGIDLASKLFTGRVAGTC